MKVFYGYFAAVNAITFIAYGIDKLKAKFKAWRISEKTLLLLGVLGGFIGALLGMQIFRHKTRHALFYIVNLLSMVLWSCAFTYIAFIR